MNRDQAAEAIKSADNLYTLRDALIAFGDTVDHTEEDLDVALSRYGIDICELKSFGQEPSSTQETWSWDNTHLLVGVGPFRDWTISPR